MNETPDNPPAFPSATAHHVHYKGMSLRDWFAGQALMGGVAAATPYNFSTPDQCASMAYQIADALLQERAK